MSKTFQGADCSRGHGGLRYFSNYGCVTCAADNQRELARRRRAARPERPLSAWAEAKANRQTTYLSGEPCPHGHLSQRFVSSRGCVACAEDRLIANPARRKEIALDYYYRHRTRILSDWCVKNAAKPKRPRHLAKGRDPIKTRIRAKRYEDAHRELKRARGRAWIKANPDRAKAARHARRARLAGCEGRYTVDDIAQIRLAQGDQCIYCETPLSERGSIDHIIPVTRGGTNWPSNIQLTCKPCNSSKGNKLPHEFLAMRKSFASSHFGRRAAAFQLTERA